jgi:hypothetical protein
MYIADMHSDSLGCVSSGRGLVTDYNTSKKYPQLTFYAAMCLMSLLALLTLIALRRRDTGDGSH